VTLWRDAERDADVCVSPTSQALADLNELKAWSAIVYTAWDR
jgi:hypothetical protein